MFNCIELFKQYHQKVFQRCLFQPWFWISIHISSDAEKILSPNNRRKSTTNVSSSDIFVLQYHFPTHNHILFHIDVTWPFFSKILICDLTLQSEKQIYTVQCRYNAVNFLPNPHKIHLIARPLGRERERERLSLSAFLRTEDIGVHIVHPLGRDMGCNLWFDTLIYILSQSTQCGMKYPVILDRVITALYCTMFFPELFSSYEYLLLYNTKNRRYKLPKLTFLKQIGRLHTFRFIKQFIRKFMSAINLRFNQHECIQNVSSGHSSFIQVPL